MATATILKTFDTTINHILGTRLYLYFVLVFPNIIIVSLRMASKNGAVFCGGIYRDIVAVASRFPGK